MAWRKKAAISRREFGKQAATVTAGLAAGGVLAAEGSIIGAIRGEPTAEKVGMQMLAAGGNAIDAVVAAAFAAAIVVPHQTGIGGYGGAVTLAVEGGKRITSIDFNTTAPAAMKLSVFQRDAAGSAVNDKNKIGWLAAGVPGILAGLQLTLEKYGTKPFREVVQPAIALAREGFRFGESAVAARGTAKQLAADPGSAALYFRNGNPLAASDHYSNPDLARMLEQLAKDNSVEAFYRGDIAERIAAAFGRNGGLVTVADMAAYRAREVEPITMKWGDCTVHTAPLAAGGATAVEALLLLKELKGAERDPTAVDTVQLQIEALRYAWQDRLQYLGDPQYGDLPLDRLLAADAIRSAAGQIEKAVATKKPLSVRVTSQSDQGTINLSAADAKGNMAALTLTHGDSFGARVTVPGLGLTLGHGMSRFELKAGHPNAPGPRKQPLHNMCPTVISKNGRAQFAVGARGGRRIPNAVFEVLLQLVARGKTLPEAVAAPRMQTEGTLAVAFEKAWPSPPLEELKERGYMATIGATATIHAGLTGDGVPIAAMR